MEDTIVNAATTNFSFKKTIWALLSLIFTFPIFWGFGIWFLSIYFAYLSGRNAGDPPMETLLLAVVALLVFIPIPIIALISYAMNTFKISDGQVFIRKGLSGRSISFGIGEAVSFQHAYSRGKNAIATIRSFSTSDAEKSYGPTNCI
jgi:hypothetical protein